MQQEKKTPAADAGDTPKKLRDLSILQKGKRGIVRTVFSRFGMILALFLLQLGLMLFLFFRFENSIAHIYGLSVLFSLVMVLFLLNSDSDPTSKITWLIIISLFPVFGALLYLYTRSDLGHRALKEKVAAALQKVRALMDDRRELEAVGALSRIDGGAARLAWYVRHCGPYPVYQNTEVVYCPTGEAKFERMLQELRRAEKYVFLEYFIIDEGKMWDAVLEILVEKAERGVDVRLLYDGTCEFNTLPHDYPARLRSFGIKCKMFAPILPFLSTHYNYRDHRKILVIDGKVAFNGGVNIADEYINEKEKFGHWKDTAVMLRGDAVESFTMMFLQMWALDEKETDFAAYLLPPAAEREMPSESTAKAAKDDAKDARNEKDCFVMPYADCPLDGDKVGERVYTDLLNRAQRYVSIMTPYLILDGVMENALKFAAERGVNVSVILPGIPDKKAPYALAKTHYASLLASGVRIYEYTPGFVHAKVFVVDGREAVVGTINLDYRSLYHHFECATYMYGASCIDEIKKDFDETLSHCRAVTPQTVKEEKLSMKVAGFLLKAVAPLL